MKCPKCHYLSFEPEPRCKHCGYDFSLAEPDLAIRPGAGADDDDDRAPLADFRLHDADVGRAAAPLTLGPMRGAAAVQPFAAVSAGTMTLERPMPDFRAEPPLAKAAPAPVTTELPLFVKGLADAEAAAAAATAAVAESDAPLVKVPVTPRAPLAVRRQAPDTARAAMAEAAEIKPARKLGPFDHDLLEDLQRIEAKAAGRSAPGRSGDEGWRNAGRRLAAAAIDLTFLAGLVATVVWFTLRQCDLSLAQARALPALPMSLFLTMIVVGYLFLFTAASGQTIGKMLLGLRVIGGPENVFNEPPTLRQATYRALLTLPSVVVLGLGFLPALVGHGLALHDRLTHTRVIRA
jgi:uncharacterized RDD family membrane protein YckC